MATANLPRPARVHAALARALDWIWPTGAAWAYADALAHAPHSAELHFLRGRALGGATRWREAARSLARAVQLEPTSVEYQGALVLALGLAGRDRELLSALRRFARLRPGEGEIHLLIGMLQRRAGRPADALRSFRLAVRLAPTPRSHRFTLGELLLGREGWQDALEVYRSARELDRPAASPRRAHAGRSALNFHPGRQRAPTLRVAKSSGAWRPEIATRLRQRTSPLRALLRTLLRRGTLALDRERRLRALRRAWRQTQPTSAR